MNNRFPIILSTLILLSVVTTQTARADVLASEYTMRYVPFPPFWLEEADENGSMGISYDLMKIIYEKAGLKVSFIPTPYARVLKTVEDGSTTFINWGDSPEHNKFVHLPLTPGSIELIIIAKQDQPMMPKELHEFKGKTIGIVRGWNLMQFEPLRSDEEVKFYNTSKIENAVKMVSKGRVEYMITFSEPYNAVDSKLKDGLKTQSLAIVKGYSVAIPKSFPNSEAISKVVEDAFIELRDNGALDNFKPGFTERKQ